MFKFNFKILLAATAGLFAIAVSTPMAHAATMQFVGSTQGTDFAITFDDDTTGQINVRVTSAANPNQADLLGLAFNWDGTPAPSAPSDFHFVSSNTGEAITSVCTNTLSCGGGLNFNGTGVTSFDYIVRMGAQGTQGGVYLEDFRFYVASSLSLDDALGDEFGIRAQSTGPNGNDSIKLVRFQEVPIPASGFLLLGGLAMLRRRRKKAA